MQKQPTKATKSNSTKSTAIKAKSSKATKATKATGKAIAKTVKAPKVAPVLPTLNNLGALNLAQYAIAVGVEAKRKPTGTIASVKIAGGVNSNMDLAFNGLTGKTLHITLNALLTSGGTLSRLQTKAIARYANHIELSYNGSGFAPLSDTLFNGAGSSAKINQGPKGEHGGDDKAVAYVNVEGFIPCAHPLHGELNGVAPTNAGAKFRANLAKAFGARCADYPELTGDVKPNGQPKTSSKTLRIKWQVA